VPQIVVRKLISKTISQFPTGSRWSNLNRNFAPGPTHDRAPLVGLHWNWDWDGATWSEDPKTHIAHGNELLKCFPLHFSFSSLAAGHTLMSHTVVRSAGAEEFPQKWKSVLSTWHCSHRIREYH